MCNVLTQILLFSSKAKGNMEEFVQIYTECIRNELMWQLWVKETTYYGTQLHRYYTDLVELDAAMRHGFCAQYTTYNKEETITKLSTSSTRWRNIK